MKKFDLKSIITLIVVSVLAIGVLVIIAGIPFGFIDTETAKTVVMSFSENFDKALLIIITFYFAKKAAEQKKDGET